MESDKLNNLAINEFGFIFDPTTGYSYNANETAMMIIKMLLEKRTHEEICDSLFKQYDVDKDVLKRDIDFFMSQLVQYGIIDWRVDDAVPSPK